MMTGKSRLPVTATILVVSLVFLGIGALPAGLMFVMDPSGGSLGMSSDWLADSPFRTFFIPGLFLASVLGFWSLVVALSLIPSVRQFYAHPTSSPEGRSGVPHALRVP